MTFATIVLGTIPATSRTSVAGLTLASSSGTSFYGVANTLNFLGPQSPLFNTVIGSPGYGEMLAPGGTLPQLGALFPQAQFSSSTTLATAFTTNSISTLLPPSFGSASTSLYAAPTGSLGLDTGQGGVFWSVATLRDNAPFGSYQASVSFSTATATYVNNTNSMITFRPDALLSIDGTLSLGSTLTATYVAGGLSTSYQLSGSTTATSLASISLGASSNGALVASSGSIDVSGNRVRGTGTSTGATVLVAVGQSITLSAQLTLISGSGFRPSFVIPEPSTIVLLGSGATMSGFWVLSRRRRRWANS